MATKRTPLNRGSRRRISNEAIAAWREGRTWDLHDALDLAPFQMTPFPPGYGDVPYCYDPNGWNAVEIKALQDALYEIAGEPGKRQCASQ